MKLKSYLYILMAVVATSSCKKSFLDEDPSTAIDAATSIKTANDMADAVNGMYTASSSYKLFGRDVPVLGDLLADNAYVSSANSGRYISENAYNFISTSAEASDIWNQGYYTILQANRIISAGLTSDETVDQLRGEAYTMRALVYLNLVNFFASPYPVNPNAAGVPIVTIPTYVTGPYEKPARNTVAEVYQRIITDLDSAYLLMPATSIGSTYHATSSNYIAKYAAKAIEARAYLYMGDYDNARDAALLVTAGGGYSLAGTAAAFSEYWSSATAGSAKLETIFELNLNTSSNNGTNGLDYIYSQNGYGDILCTDELYNAYSLTDNRRSLLVDGIRTSNGAQAYLVNKYTNVNATDRDELKIIRYAEVLLTLAESYARLGDNTNAKVYLNQLAQNRDATFAGYTSTGTQLITDILNERRKELAFEGLRFFDFSRLNMVINRPVQENGYSSYPTVSLTDFRRLQPIPQTEIDVNSNITQNAGY
ncbi:RagB/SusD family nutrient uptake outer membrane protein [Pedobacter sp. AW31-3R]|uniref:RagB/SusD family nutrient uptake outer membrane protein n=1 Tax=Pedobacter sp. AW31-3R TaxID=3445781 RepID=UPI003FA145E4